MPLSPGQLGITPAQKFAIDSICSALDVQLTDSYDGSGVFESRPFFFQSLPDRVPEEVCKAYQRVGWKGAHYWWAGHQLHIRLQVNEQEDVK